MEKLSKLVYLVVVVHADRISSTDEWAFNCTGSRCISLLSRKTALIMLAMAVIISDGITDESMPWEFRGDWRLLMGFGKVCSC